MTQSPADIVEEYLLQRAQLADKVYTIEALLNSMLDQPNADVWAPIRAWWQALGNPLIQGKPNGKILRAFFLDEEEASQSDAAQLLQGRIDKFYDERIGSLRDNIHDVLYSRADYHEGFVTLLNKSSIESQRWFGATDYLPKVTAIAREFYPHNKKIIKACGEAEALAEAIDGLAKEIIGSKIGRLEVTNTFGGDKLLGVIGKDLEKSIRAAREQLHLPVKGVDPLLEHIRQMHKGPIMVPA